MTPTLCKSVEPPCLLAALCASVGELCVSFFFFFGEEEGGFLMYVYVGNM